MGTKDDTSTVVAQVLRDEQAMQDNHIRLSSGVVLRAKQAPPMTLISILAAFPKPKAPVQFIAAMGREMENPDDPGYQESLKAWQTEQSNVMLNALIVSGTELLSVPEGVPGPDDPTWMDQYELLGLPMRRENASWRYLRWVQHVAAPVADDIKQITKVVGRLSGIPERAVASAESFPAGDPNSGGRGSPGN